MNTPAIPPARRLRVVMSLVLAAVVAAAGGVLLSGQEGPGYPARTTDAPPRDRGRQLGTKMNAAFTMAAVGDFIQAQPISQLADPAFQNLVSVLRGADVAIGNMESSVIDLDSFSGPVTGQYGPKAVAADIRAMGIRMMNRANNHAMDSGAAGMLATNAKLEAAGIVPAGSGRNLDEARAAQYFMSPKGRVGLMGIFPPADDSFNRTLATYRLGNVGGLAGVDPLHLTMHHVVTEEQMDGLRKIRDAIHARRPEVTQPVDPARPGDPAGQLVLFGQHFKVGPRTGEFSYTMNPGDLRDILRSIRNGKYNSDFMTVMIHAHQNRFEFQAYSFDNGVPDYLSDLAHQAIDNGADAFIASGVHTLRPVEVYKGKPVFYGLSNFVMDLGKMPAGLADYGDENPFTTDTTPAQAAERAVAWLGKAENLEALLTTSRFEGGKLVEIRLYPVDVGQDASRPVSRVGIPMTPSPEMARRVLEKMQRISRPFGTVIAIENNVGVIRVPAS